MKSAMEYLAKTTPVIVTGSRDFDDIEYVFSILDHFRARSGTDLLVVHGACEGVDLMAEAWAKEREQPYRAFPAQWKRRGDAGEPWRNAVMIHHGWIADMDDEPVYPTVLAVHDHIDDSRGTIDCMNRALEMKLKVYLFEGISKDGKPVGKLQVQPRKKAKKENALRRGDETSAG